jgi:hypothetical protein
MYFSGETHVITSASDKRFGLVDTDRREFNRGRASGVYKRGGGAEVLSTITLTINGTSFHGLSIETVVCS